MLTRATQCFNCDVITSPVRPPPILMKIGLIIFLLGVGSFLFARHQTQVITAAAAPQLSAAHTVGARKNGWGEGTETLSATKHATHSCAALPCDPKHWSQFYTGALSFLLF